MPNRQSVLFTVMPRGVILDGSTRPVSVFVTPRLTGDPTLGGFPDWRHWTTLLSESGLAITLACGAATQTVHIDRSVLQPALWEALFTDRTLVNPYQFDDYSGRGIISYPMRRALSALKAIYQTAGVTLAIPRGGVAEDDQSPLRRELRDMIEGLQIHWSPAFGDELRRQVRIAGNAGQFLNRLGTDPAFLDGEGLITQDPNPVQNRAAAQPFAVFHHMPTPPRATPFVPDWDKALDFHQALSAINAYPLLQRALGLVFDLDLPAEFIAATGGAAPGTITVESVMPGWEWAVPTTVPRLATAYISLAAGGRNLFLAAPRVLVDPAAPSLVIGLLNLDPGHFGLAQVDIDGSMHKAIMLAETFDPDSDANLFPGGPAQAPHPEIFDPEATLPYLRSGAFTLYADGRAVALLDTIGQNKAFNDALEANAGQPRPFFAEDLVRGWRLDIWDSRTGMWHSLHRRRGIYRIGEQQFGPAEDEGFVQLAATQPAPGAQPAENDIYLHEAIARWPGWSLSAPRPGKHLSRYADPDKAIPPDMPDPDYAENEPVTPFNMKAEFAVVRGSLPQLRFGRRYRLRARAVDLAGNSLALGDPLADLLSQSFALPQDPEGFAYLRYEPVAAPLVVMRDPAAVTGPGSAVDRLVIRTFNSDPSLDTAAADTSASDRHILPPRASVEICEHLGLFDDAAGHLSGDAATWTLIGARDSGELPLAAITVAGKTDNYPLITTATFEPLPYLPDPLSRGAALRDLPGSGQGVGAAVAPGIGGDAAITYAPLSDPNPRPGSAALVSFDGGGDWQALVGFRLVPSETPVGAHHAVPHWDPTNRVLTVFLPKGSLVTLPLTSYLGHDDLALMGQWQWLRQFVERVTVTNPTQEILEPGGLMDQIAHVLQRAVEGGHWMLTPPRLLTLVHAVQQPLGHPAFRPLDIVHIDANAGPDPLQTAPIAGRQDPTELAPVTAWRRLGAPEAYLIGALHIHGSSTAKIDITATWQEPIDDLSQPGPTMVQRHEHVEEIKLISLAEGYIMADAQPRRQVGYYDPEHDQIAFVRAGDTLGIPGPHRLALTDAAPRHFFSDPKRRRIHYTATATSRFREYFGPGLAFTRDSAPAAVDVPASARPLAPVVRYVIPTFGWERQTDTNLRRSVRFGGGLRVYLERPWYSSGGGELLGVALWSTQNGTLDRDKFKPFITQWGMDPIWKTADLFGIPTAFNFAGGSQPEFALSLEEPAAAALPNGPPGFIDVVGFVPEFDASRGLWFADLTVNTFAATYTPFVRLALVRYQPHALPDAKVSRVVLADFAQLTPDRAAMVTSDPFHPRTLRVVVSGVAPQGPPPVSEARPAPPGPTPPPTEIRLHVQQRDPFFVSDLAWIDAGPGVATITVQQSGAASGQPDLELFAATVNFAQPPAAGEFRLVIEEVEHVSADYTAIEGGGTGWPGRLIYAEIFEIDAGLAGAP
jgi:hypothetical protein